MDFQRIISPSNPRIREAVAARESGRKKGRSTFVVEGPHLIEMAVGAGAEIGPVFFTGSFSSRKEGRGMLEILSRKMPDVFEVSPRLLNRIADTETPQGVVAVVKYYPPSFDDLRLGGRPLITVADGVQDPGNLGTIIRSSDAAGADCVILLPGTCDPFMPKTIRATAGSIFNIPIVRADDVAGVLKWLKEKTIRLAVTASDGKQTIFEARLDIPVAFALGNEAHGASEQIRKAADMLLRIPIYGRAESLNVATSAAICLYEAVRQRSRTSRLE